MWLQISDIFYILLTKLLCKDWKSISLYYAASQRKMYKMPCQLQRHKSALKWICRLNTPCLFANLLEKIEQATKAISKLFRWPLLAWTITSHTMPCRQEQIPTLGPYLCRSFMVSIYACRKSENTIFVLKLVYLLIDTLKCTVASLNALKVCKNKISSTLMSLWLISVFLGNGL